MCWHSFIKQSHITTPPSRTSSFAAILKSTASFTFVELCKRYRSTVEFNFVDSTALINLGDPCKRAFSDHTKSAFTFRLLGAFAKFRKATISFIMSVCPPVRPHGTTIFVEFYMCVFFENLLNIFKFPKTPDKNNRQFASRPTYWSYLAQFFLE